MLGISTSLVSWCTYSTAISAARHVDTPRVSSPNAAAMRANRSGSPEWLYSMTGPSRRAVSAP